MLLRLPSESVQTILNTALDRNEDLSNWSEVWSTDEVPGMDTATGGAGGRRRIAGRRTLRLAAHALCAMLAMNCRVTAGALKGNYIVFISMLVVAMGLLGNPLRHFEVYLGQWSISGPGRAFRIIPILDGLGFAICLNALVRAITCSVIAAITLIYFWHAVSDEDLPVHFCRTMNLQVYNATLQEVNLKKVADKLSSLEYGLLDAEKEEWATIEPPTTVDVHSNEWRNLPEEFVKFRGHSPKSTPRKHKTYVCNETYSGKYPHIFKTPPYNHFYVEVMHYREGEGYYLNLQLLICTVIVWVIIWSLIIVEKIHYHRVVYNNLDTWCLAVPWLWSIAIITISILNFHYKKVSLRSILDLGSMTDIMVSLTDAFEIAMYVHASSVGTEIVHGKGLNHYAQGHIDNDFHSENVWLTCMTLVFTAIYTSGAAFCALTDYVQLLGLKGITESTLWVIPMYSKCASRGKYTHFMSAIIFSGLSFSYIVITFSMVKTALHTIFEYRVKLVFVEQYLVAGLIFLCCGASVLVSLSSEGVAMLEAVDSIMSGISMPFICAVETFGFVYLYRSSDFISDMNVATEENTCSSRLGVQWQITPFICCIMVIMKICVLTNSEIPGKYFLFSLIPLMSVTVTIPLRALHNFYAYSKPRQR